MARSNTYVVKFRRKREGRTNYKKRLALLLSHKPRVVIRITNKRIIAQLVEFDYKGDKVIITIDSGKLRKYNWKYSLKNTPAAYLLGLLFGKTCLEKKYKEGIIDIGLRTFRRGTRIASFIKGLLDSGFYVPHGEDIFPSEDRIKGKHIEEFAKKLETDEERYKKQFSDYIKKGIDPKNIVSDFEKVKENILGEKHGGRK